MKLIRSKSEYVFGRTEILSKQQQQQRPANQQTNQLIVNTRL